MPDRPLSEPAPNRQPLVSVVMPVHDRAATVARAVTSVQAQTTADWELVVVDDGSTDGSADVVAGIAGSDPRVHLLQQPNAGAAAARNTGIAAARGQRLAFLDSDDTWDPEFLEVLLGAADDAGQRAVFCTHRVRQDDLPDRLVPARHLPEPNRVLLRYNVVSTQTVLLPTAAVRDVGGFDVRMRRLQDWELWLRLLPRLDFVHVDRALVTVYRTTDSITTGGHFRSAHRALVRRHWRALIARPSSFLRLVKWGTLGPRSGDQREQ